MSDQSTTIKQKDVFGPHWEQIQALAVNANGTRAAYGGTRADGQATSLYLFDPNKGEDQGQIALDAPASAIAFYDDDIVFCGQSDGSFGCWDLSKKPKSLAQYKAASAILSIAVSVDGNTVYISEQSGAITALTSPQLKPNKKLTWEWPADVPCRALVSDTKGQWLAAAGGDGIIRVYNAEDGKLIREMPGHEGSINAMLLHPQEYRLISTGDDRSIRMWYLQGEVEFENRAESGSHDAAILGMQLGPVRKDEGGEDLPPRLFTSAADGSVKIWPLDNKRKPKTLDIDTEQRAVRCLAVIAPDNVVKALIGSEAGVIIGLQCNAKTEPEGTFLHLSSEFHKLRNEFKEQKNDAREKALKALVDHIKDPAAYAQIIDRMQHDAHQDVRALAASLLAQATERRPIKELRDALNDEHTKVRKAALETLRSLQGEQNTAPLAYALASNHADTRQLAIKGLVPLHKDSPQVSRMLFQTLVDNSVEVQITALDGLEQIYPSTSKAPNTKPHVYVLRSCYSGLQRETLLRIHRNKWTHLPEIQPLLGRLLEHAEESLRQLALDVTIAGEPKLAKALRERDEILDRALLELDTVKTKKSDKDKADDDAKTTKASAKTKAKRPTEAPPSLDDATLQPLLMAQMSTQDDIALRAATLLAALRDLRAFGTLLRLSGQSVAHYRAETANALEQLQDPRVLPCLKSLLHDGDKDVRNAAFDSLVSLSDSELDVAEAAFHSPHPDTRNRGLQKLLPGKNKQPEGQALALLEATLSDNDEGVRNEAFKILWNAFKKSPEHCLGPALRSDNAAMRTKAINEIAGSFGKEAWAHSALAEALTHTDKDTRASAYQALIKLAAKDDPTPHQLALTNDDVALRRQAIDKLSGYKADAVKPLLLAAVGDAEADIRSRSLEQMLKRFSKDADLLAQALEIPHWDVRLQVAAHLADLGDVRALEVAHAYLTSEQALIKELLPPYIPQDKTEIEVLPEATQQHIQASRLKIIEVISRLGLPTGVDAITPFLDAADKQIVSKTALAITRCAGTEHLDLLRTLLSHKDKEIRIFAAEGLLRHGDAQGLSKIQDLQKSNDQQEQQRGLAAYFTHGAATEAQFLRCFHASSSVIHEDAFALLLAREWQTALAGDGPTHLSSLLSNPNDHVRLAAANALAQRTDRDGFVKYVETCLASAWPQGSTQKEKNEIDKASQQLTTWLAALTSESSQMRFAAASLLDVRRDPKAFTTALKLQMRHFEAPSAPKASKKDKGPGATELAALAFGTYADLLRSRLSANAFQPILQHVTLLVENGHISREAALPALRHALEDNNNPELSKATFQTLQTLFPDPDPTSIRMAYQSPHSHVGLAALAFLATQSTDQARDLTIEGMQSQVREVRFKAAEQLAQYYDQDSLEPMIRALESEHADVRLKVVDRLLNSQDDRVLDALNTALGSDHDDLRLKAAEALAGRKQQSTFDVLVDFLYREEHYTQHRASRALLQLGAAGTAAAIIQRIDEDIEDTADTNELIRALGELRQPEAGPWLLATCNDSDYYKREAAHDALLAIPGTNPEKRDNALYIEYLTGLLQCTHSNYRSHAIRQLSQLKEASPQTLIQMLNDRDESVRLSALQGLVHRNKEFKESIDPLLPLLEHKDTSLRFEAASALAEHGRQEAFVTLFTNFQTSMDANIQIQAVEGLGKLGDQRAFAPLMALWAEDAEHHNAQAVAAEAIGRLAPKEQHNEVRELLDRLMQHDDSHTRIKAMSGMRYFDPKNAISLIGQAIKQASGWSGWELRQAGARMLGEIGSKDAEDTLLSLLNDDDSDVVRAAVESLIKLFGENEERLLLVFFDSQQVKDAADEAWEKAAAYVAKEAAPVEVLKRLPLLLSSSDANDLFLDEVRWATDTSNQEDDDDVDEETGRILQQGLLQREPLPLKGILAGLKEENLKLRANAVFLLSQIQDKSVTKPLKEACQQLATEWQNRDLRSSTRAQLWQLALWAIGNSDPSGAVDAAIAALQDNDAPAMVKAQAAQLLGGAGKASKATTEALQAALAHPQEKVRRQAHWALSQSSNASKLLQSLPAFPSASQHLLPATATTKELPATLLLSHPARRELLPALIAQKQSALFVDLANDKETQTQLLAIQALARIADPIAIDALDTMRKDDKRQDDIRREAFRAYRRAKRVAQRAS